MHSKALWHVDEKNLFGAISDFFFDFIALFLSASNLSCIGCFFSDDSDLHDAQKLQALLVYQDTQ